MSPSLRCVRWLAAALVGLPATGSGSAGGEGADTVLADVLQHMRVGCAELSGVEASELSAALQGAEVAQDAAERSAQALLAACGSLGMGAEEEAEEPMGRGEGAEMEEPFGHHMPWLQGLGFWGAALVFVVLWETCWLQTSLFAKRRDALMAGLRRADERFRVAAARGFKVKDSMVDGKGGISGIQQVLGRSQHDNSDDDDDDDDDDDEEAEEDSDEEEEPAPAMSATLSEAHAQQFWTRVQQAATQPLAVTASQQESSTDTIQFQQRCFHAFASAGRATITVERNGACEDQLEVRARTLERGFEGYKAKAGKHFEQCEATLRFAHGQRSASFAVKLMPAGVEWCPTLWFAVELIEVVAGNALIAAPMILRWKGDKVFEGNLARVYIVAEAVFPYDVPSGKLRSGFQLAWYYIRERIAYRGFKYWKTMGGILYDPFHNVLVQTVVQKEMIAWACDWARHGDGCHWRILLLACVQLLSTAIFAWGDRVQFLNRSRTGATRMYHRWQLLSKMLMLEQTELGKYPGPHWLYTAIQHAESMTIDAYWQSFKLAQSLLGLVLSIFVTLIFFFTDGNDLAGREDTYLFMLSMVAILPPTFLWIQRRRERIWDLLFQRARGEEMWMSTLSWVAHACHSLYCFGPRERAWLEQRFSQETKFFMSKHVVARDMVNDSVWVNRWLASLSYCVVLYVGAVQLVKRSHGQESTANAVNFVLLLKVSWEFQKYMQKMSDSYTRMQRAGVSILRVKELLDSARHWHGDEANGDTSGSGNGPARVMIGGFSRLQVAPTGDAIELHEVEYIMPGEHHGVASVSNLQMVPGSLAVIPLRHVVHVTGGSESARMTFLALAAHVLKPTKGRVSSPLSSWAVMLPSQPVGLPDATVLEALQVATMPRELARCWAHALGLPPEGHLSSLGPGRLQELTLARTLMRDPSILVLDRPLALVEAARRPRLQSLLRAWQQGGAQRIIEWLSSETLAAEGSARVGHRTLVITGEDMQGEAAPRGDDVHLDLGPLLLGGVPDHQRTQRPHGVDDEGSESESTESDASLVASAAAAGASRR